MRWNWIAIAATVPTAVALLIAWPIWRTRHAVIGNLIGAGVIFAFTIGFMGLEYAVIEQKDCVVVPGTRCMDAVTAFTRIAAYAFVAFFDAFVVFLVGLVVERRRARRFISPEWR